MKQCTEFRYRQTVDWNGSNPDDRHLCQCGDPRSKHATVTPGSDAGNPDSQSLQQETIPGGTAMHGQTTLRFYVAEMTRYAGHDNVKITLKPAYNNGKGNEDWATATPSGEMWINVNNPSAVKWYEDAMNDKADIHITMQRVEDIG